MAMKFIDMTGKTEEEAILKALAELGLERDDVSVEILERAKSGFFGIGATPAKVRVSYGLEEEETPAVPDVEKSQPSVFAKPTLRRGLFLALMALSLCGMAVALECIFLDNSLLANGKLLSLLAILFVAANTDARYRIIPNALVLTGLVLRVVFWIME